MTTKGLMGVALFGLALLMGFTPALALDDEGQPMIHGLTYGE